MSASAQELALDLTCSDHKTGHSGETVGVLTVRLDGLVVDLQSLPAARWLEARHLCHPLPSPPAPR